MNDSDTEQSRFEGLALIVVATGMLLSEAPALLQILWLFVVGAAVFVRPFESAQPVGSPG